MASTPTGDGQPDAADGFDPTRVPPYPVLTLTGADDPENVTVDGEPITGEDAYDHALARCAARAAELGGAVRVRGIDKTGTAWPMVVTSDGALHDLSHLTPDAITAPRPRHPRRRALLITAGVLAAAGLTTGGILGYRTLTAPEPAPPPPLYPGAGANLPVHPPTGIDVVATWAVLINPDATPVLLADQRILLTTASGALVILDALTGQLRWTGTPYDASGTTGELTIDETPVLATYTDDEAILWPLDDPTAPAPQTLTVEEGRAETLITSAPEPAWVLEPQTVSYLAGNTLALVDVPVPAIPAGTHNSALIAVAAGTWLSITPDNVATEQPLEGAPADAEPVQGRVLGAEHLAVLWNRGETAHLTLHHLPDGALIAELADLRQPRSGDLTEPLRSPDGATWHWHSTLIQPAAGTPLTSVAALTIPDGEDEDTHALEVETISDNAIWGHLGSTPVRYDIPSGQITTHDADATIPLGESRDGSLAYIVATRLEQTSLYALPATIPAATSDGGQ